ncbi:MAG: endonuclease/exonuclease/phosphatase family protein [Bryobacterales bacterium]|nr:endonuclease/exonuclease/phosphatase family protein [Bryobacterales bacterium]
MRVLFLLLMALGGAFGQTLRVLSYNIHHGEGVDGRLDLERIAKVILSVQPDVVALQEVDGKTRRTKGVDQPAELARLTGMRHFFGPAIQLEGGHYGNVVLAKVPAVFTRNAPLPGKERRALMEVTLTVGGKKVAFFATHLDAGREETERVAAAREILKLARRKHPAVLAGDLNAVVESETMRILGKEWVRAGAPEMHLTIPVGAPRRQIDYVLMRPGKKFRVVEVRVLDEAVASDHRAILAVLELVK